MSKKALNEQRRVTVEKLKDPPGDANSSHIPAMLLLQQSKTELKTERVAPSSVLARVRDFLPQMAAANDQLTAAAADGSDLISIEKVAPSVESSSSPSSSASSDSDDSTSDEDEPKESDSSRKIQMDVMLFANGEEGGDDSDDDEEVPAAWRAENDESKSKEIAAKKRKIEEL